MWNIVRVEIQSELMFHVEHQFCKQHPPSIVAVSHATFHFLALDAFSAAVARLNLLFLYHY